MEVEINKYNSLAKHLARAGFYCLRHRGLRTRV